MASVLRTCSGLTDALTTEFRRMRSCVEVVLGHKLDPWRVNLSASVDPPGVLTIEYQGMNGMSISRQQS